MPYTVSADNYHVSPPLPQNLGHKPVFAMPYKPFDGIYGNNTDVRYLSVGLAQYEESEVSVKSMRHTGDQWSPQAEELPVHRVIDMTLFVAKALFDADNGVLILPGGLFLRQQNCISISKESIRSPSELDAFYNWLQGNGPLIKERLNALAGVLNDLQKRGKI